MPGGQYDTAAAAAKRSNKHHETSMKTNANPVESPSDTTSQYANRQLNPKVL